MIMPFSHLKRFVLLGCIVSLFILQGLYVYAFFIEPNILSVEKIRIYSPPLYKAWGGLKVVHIADLHLTNFSLPVIKLIQAIKRIKPDIILVSGDIIGSRGAIGNFYKFFSLLKAKKATYIVFGDSDSAIGDIFDEQRLRRYNVYYIQDRALHLNFKKDATASFWLVGCFGSENDFIENLDISKDEVKILLTHKPAIIKTAALKGFDLVLAGDTHGSQTGIPILRKIFGYAYRSPYVSGLFKVRDTLLFVNRGIYSEKHVRLFCPPQLAILEFFPQWKRNYKVLPQDR